MKNYRFSFQVVALLLWAIISAGGVRAGVLQTLHTFNGTDGQNPQGTLTFAADGLLYGTTSFGGTNGAGTIFKVTTNGAFTSLLSLVANTNGANPLGRLLLSGGALYVTAANGGPFGHGAIFRFNTNAEFLQGFPNFVTDGSTPQAGLCDGLNNELFGTTLGGGANGNGAVYKIYFSDGTETLLHSFTGTDGQSPNGGLVLNPTNGYFYGTTISGGTNGGYGTVFKIAFGGSFNSVSSFDNTNGSHPWATLALGQHGVLYGTTVDGGSYGYGTVFSVSNDVTRMVASLDYTNGANPYAELTAAADGTLYGVARNGGANNRGTIFKVTTDGTLTSLISFNYANGANPYGGMVIGGDGQLYGTTIDGGGGSGTVFRFIINPPAPEFLSVVKTNADVALTCNSVSGGHYQLQYKTYLLQSSWSNLGFEITATNSTIIASDVAPPETQRFYRAVLIQP